MTANDTKNGSLEITLNRIKAEVEKNGVHRFLHIQKTFLMVSKLLEIHSGSGFRKRTEVKLAALLHDWTKNYISKKQFEIIKKLSVPQEDLNIPGLWHAWTSAYIAEKEWKITDPYILKLIKFHPTGSPDFDLGGLILFVADFCEEGRTHSGVKKIRSLAMKDITEAAFQVQKYKIEYLMATDSPIHTRGMKFYNNLLLRIHKNGKI